MPRTAGLAPNLAAFLDTIALSEIGAILLKQSDDGYNVLVGSTPQWPHLFPSYASHPNIMVYLPNGLASTAAGRYQVLARFFFAYQPLLGLTDFGPDNQDRIALQMIGECGARDDITNGLISSALIKCSSRWASLPAATYGQHTNNLDTLLAAWTAAGGIGTPA